jgi:glycine dehydrogenase subunit 1
MRYIPHTEQDIARMLEAIGKRSIDDLFSIIPEDQRPDGALTLPPPLCEAELMAHLREIGAPNQPQSREAGTLVFAGAGCNAHAIPAAVDALASRSEFYTAYTPYQPELSQGTLLAIFEFQTIVCELLGMEVANASMYDGASGVAEAVLMARRLTRRDQALLSASLHPEYAATCATYVAGMSGGRDTLATIPVNAGGRMDLDALGAALDDTVAAVVVQSPNFFGLLEDLGPISEAAHAVGALVVAVCTEPLALALLQAPGQVGADIAVAEGLGLAGPPNMGGPGVGLFAARGKKAVRSMPGRIVGQTVDSEGRPGFVLTLSTREQHIRREKATSNICTNHGLMALRFAIHLSLLGKVGFEALARLNLSKATFARDRICELDGYEPRFDGPCFNEFCVRVPGGDADAVVREAVSCGVVPGVALGRFHPEHADSLLVHVNESHRREDIERLVKALKRTA